MSDSPIDEIAETAIRLVLLAAQSKGAAMAALCRKAGNEYARIQGEEQAAILQARQARIHQERASNRLRGSR